MYIQLTRNDLHKMLVDKFGTGHSFVLDYVESTKTAANRVDKPLSEMKEPPKQEAMRCIIDE